MAQTFTLAELVKITDSKRRRLQVWSEAGVLKAEPDTERRGRGVHREFQRREGIIALLLRPFADRQMPVGILIDVAHGLRQFSETEDWDIVESVHGEENPPTFLICTQISLGSAWMHTLYQPEGEEVDINKRTGEIMSRHAEYLGHPDSMTFIICLNTYLRKPATEMETDENGK